MENWSPNDSRALYNLPHWGEGYFAINDQGHLVVTPGKSTDRGVIDLYEVSQRLHEHQLALPVVVRFTDILADRIDSLCNAFYDAMAENDYRGRYTAVYPIKVNQNSSVVSEILHHGGTRVGLEAGSKPELMAVLALSDQDQGVIVCNGYKDQEYIRLALIGQQLGHRTYIVVEKFSELKLILREYQATGIRPLLGIRIRLASVAAGKWQNTGGEKSKFGLTAAQVLQVINELRQNQLLDCLKLLHFHLGSQLPNIRNIQTGLRECGQFYAQLYAMGVPVDTIDVGGGLGIDYEGTRSRSYCSRNYTVEEYARNVVHAIWETCEQFDLPHPNLISESGRALTAHHAVLITNVVDIDKIGSHKPAAIDDAEAPLVLQDLQSLLLALENNDRSLSPLEAFHDASHWLSQSQEMYLHGVLELSHRAQAEELYVRICQLVRIQLQPNIRAHRELLDELNEKLADKYFINLSIFQSLPDIWAINQIFPIVPLHKLDERPDSRGILQDITCDSDGRIDQYVDGEGLESSLPLHAYNGGEQYLLGIFLMGAYQEILGDMHNLFGDTDSINVSLDKNGQYQMHQAVPGDTVDSVLRYVKFDPERLLEMYKTKLAKAGLDRVKHDSFLADLENGLQGYTYLEE